MLNPPEHKPTVSDPIRRQPSLMQWLHRVAGVPNVLIQVRSRGNHLYLLYEAKDCPSQPVVLAQMVQALAQTDLQTLLPADQPTVYQVVLYGRAQGESRPQWGEVIHLNQLDRYVEKLQDAKTERRAIAIDSSMIVSNFSLAKQGHSDAIARYLSEAFSNLGVAVRANVKSVVLPDDPKLPQIVNLSSVFTSAQALTPKALLNRLWILCESAYSPDPSLMAEPIAQKLRDLELNGFRDAIVFSQVQGEAEPDWTLRIDLTPPNEMLKEWARWGDVAALTRLLNRVFFEQSVQVSVDLMDITLHISCQGKSVPDKARVLATLMPLLETIAPQGIHCATVYGIGDETRDHADEDPTSLAPAWVEWLNLPAAEHPALADATHALAKQGDLSAIAFQLTRLLNPDLDLHLATGGIRIQLRQRDDLMHVMTDAPTCPPQNTVTTTVADFFKALELPDLEGARVYGRRAGQSHPLWSYGVDFVKSEDSGMALRANRVVPEATPEFAASDAYVGDLLSRDPGTLTLRPDGTGQDGTVFRDRVIDALQRLLVRSHLFSLETPTALSSYEKPKAVLTHERKVAIVWGTLGLLFTLQSDWVLGQLLKPNAHAQPQPSPTVTLPSLERTPEPLSLPQLSLQKSGGFTGEPGSSDAGFTQDGQTEIATAAPTPSLEQPGSAPKALMASPLRPKAAVDPSRSPYPAFNARQLDEKLVLYRQYVAQFGAPDVLIVGSSRAMRGIDPVVLQQTLATQGYRDLKIFNFGVNGATVQVIDLIVRRILPSEKMPKLILIADGSRAFNGGKADVTFNAIASSAGFKKLPDASTASVTVATTPTEAFTKPLETISQTNSVVADSYQTFNNQLNQFFSTLSVAYAQREKMTAFLQEGFKQQLGQSSTAVEDETIVLDGQGLIDINGFLPLSVRFNPTTYYQKYSRVPGNSDADYANFSLEGQQFEALRSLSAFTRSQNIPLVFVNLPLTEVHLDPFRQEREQQFQQKMLQASGELGFTYRDLLDNWKADNDLFSDPSHLNRYGAYVVSQHIAKDPLIPWTRR
ncbi:DUF1574 domain-containing protein [Myxacorys almedinensis]|uniref:DUF1574 domain-containing protein n=1 Tax=Myxacorys almedinensis A TaxID=2690445 RepID=A0A8J8CJ65_9CYAN|nr:DUF1574 domain-containing protein [Myxacorys almedinensis]NDJ17286.1 DUF1574 domain-containing protein [Myxacorys almedinensis A]